MNHRLSVQSPLRRSVRSSYHWSVRTGCRLSLPWTIGSGTPTYTRAAAAASKVVASARAVLRAAAPALVRGQVRRQACDGPTRGYTTDRGSALRLLSGAR